MPTQSFWGQLKERKVIRAAVAYIIVGWVMMQIGEVTFASLGLPTWALTLLIVLIMLGFPIALVLAWAYELTPQGIRKDPVGLAEPPKDDEYFIGSPSIAVLPFEDMSDSGDQNYFCEGIAEEILNSLCKIANLKVASRMAAFQFGGKKADIREISRKLKVKTVLEGSVRKSGNDLRISVQLVKTSDGFHLWTKQFDRSLEDIFEIQHEIADAVANALSVSLRMRAGEKQQMVDPKAYDFFLRGLSYFAKHTQQNNKYARQMFQQAVDIEPGFGRAWAGLAYTHGFGYMYFNAANADLDGARVSSQRARELSPELTETHVSAGIVHCIELDYGAAAEAFEKAIELDPKNYEAWYFYGRAKVHEGELKKAIKLFKRASEVRPEDFQSLLLQAQLYISLGKKRRAIQVSQKGIERARAVLEINPGDIRALNMGAFALARLGETEEAKIWMSKSIRNAPQDTIIQYNAACFYSLSNEVDKALDCLENCIVQVGSINRDWLENDSDMDAIRNHPRFAAILNNFPE